MSKNFVITIARGYGSGGRLIGQMLSRDLNIPFYDRDLIYMASEESGINVELFGKMDETVKSHILPHHKYNGEIIPPESADFVSNQNLFNYQAKVIKEIAQKGPAIIVGRCADYVLKDCPNVINVYIWAPINVCVKNIMSIKPMLTEKSAEKLIRKIDTHRSEYYKFYSGHDWADYKNYDVCINTERLGIENSVKLIKSYVDIKMADDK